MRRHEEDEYFMGGLPDVDKGDGEEDEQTEEERRLAEEHSRKKDAHLKDQLGLYAKSPTAGLFAGGGGPRRRGKGRGNQPVYTEVYQDEVPDDEEVDEEDEEEEEVDENQDEDWEEDDEDEEERNEVMEPEIEEEAERDHVPEQRQATSTNNAKSETFLESMNIDIADPIWKFVVPLALLILARIISVASNHVTAAQVAKVLGWFIIASSFTVKLPMIQTMWKNETAKGLAPSKIYTEVLSYTLNLYYNMARGNPFTSWGDTLSLHLQNLVVVSLMWKYSNTSMLQMIGFTAFYALYTIVLGWIMFTADPNKIWFVPLVGASISLPGYFPQIMQNHRNKHTGALSTITQGLSTAGPAIRIFTVITEVKDPLVLFVTISSFALNLAILVQIFMYWDETNKVLAEEALARQRRLENQARGAGDHVKVE